MRVIAGDLRGRVLQTPRGRRLRPTQGQVRRVLFDIAGRAIAGSRVLDLYAGVGGIGIEALSRGAASVCFVERDAIAISCLRENLATLGLLDRSRILGVPADSGLRILADEAQSFDWIFADPPYATASAEWIERTIRGGPGGLLAPGGLFVLESSSRGEDLPRIGMLLRARSRRVGETQLDFYQWEVPDGAEGDLSRDI